MNKSYIELTDIFKKIKVRNDILAVLSWDTAVAMPRGSSDSRALQMVTLKSSIYDILSSERVAELLKSTDENDLNNIEKANFYLMIRMQQQTISVEKKLSEHFLNACIKSEMTWRIAKKENNFKLLLPELREVLNLSREIASSKAMIFNCSKYEALMQIYNPGLKIQDVDFIFDDLSKYLPNFILKVLEFQENNYHISNDTLIPLSVSYQQKISSECMKMLGFNFDIGRIDTSAHPYCFGFSQDTRITTNYNKKDFMNSIMAVIHETGHALYEQNLPKVYSDQPVGNALGMAMHESQALFFEYQIGRSKEFLNCLSKLIYKLGPKNRFFKEGELFNSVNHVRRSLIRIDADEVTYPAHVIFRYNLEKAMVNGDLEIEDLPDAWTESVQKILDIRPTSDAEGCLQDIHWPSGLYGYFPSYLIGAVIASQLQEKIDEQIKNNKELISQGKFKHINTWLAQNIHHLGSTYDIQELLIKATGKPIDIVSYKTYLSNKFLN